MSKDRGEQPVPSKGSPFWTFSLSLYRQEGVAPACISLQDGHGVDVNMLFFGLWLASEGRLLSVADHEAMEAAAGVWRAEVVVPLRSVRRLLRMPPVAFRGPAAEALRDKLKGVELEAERLQQEALFGLREPAKWGSAARELISGPDAAQRTAAANMAAYGQFLGAAFDKDAVAAVLAGFAARAAGG